MAKEIEKKNRRKQHLKAKRRECLWKREVKRFTVSMAAKRLNKVSFKALRFLKKVTAILGRNPEMRDSKLK